MRISYWSSDVCSSYLGVEHREHSPGALVVLVEDDLAQSLDRGGVDGADGLGDPAFDRLVRGVAERPLGGLGLGHHDGIVEHAVDGLAQEDTKGVAWGRRG